MQLEASAKINLGLHVLRRRGDGFHDIETVFVRIPWSDRLVVQSSPSLRLTCTDPSLPTGADNLVMVAARRLAAAVGVERGAHLHLEKHLPHGAGLGGGSSDAAATLRLLADFWKLDVEEDDLYALAVELGSDVPFFLGPPIAYGSGRGEQLSTLKKNDEPYRCPFTLVVVVPPVRISTAEAYQLVVPQLENRADLKELVQSNDLGRWRRELVNDFEAPIFERYPSVADVKATLLAAGAGYASLSGSGAAVFGMFEREDQAARAVTKLEVPGVRVWYGPLREGL